MMSALATILKSWFNNVLSLAKNCEWKVKVSSRVCNCEMRFSLLSTHTRSALESCLVVHFTDRHVRQDVRNSGRLVGFRRESLSTWRL
jgi:hypothetical protein